MVRANQAGDRFGTCVTVLGEIEVGRLQVSDPDKYQRLMSKLLGDFVKIWPMSQQTAECYGQVYQELKVQGRALSQVDIMIGHNGPQR